MRTPVVQTHLRQSLILKLFTTVTGSPFPIVPRYAIRSKSSYESCSSTGTAKTALSRNLTSWFEYFTCSNSCEQNLIYSLVEVLIKNFVFVLKTIIQRLKVLVHENCMSKVLTLNPSLLRRTRFLKLLQKFKPSVSIHEGLWS